MQVDLALLDVIGPYLASVHTYDVPTRTWRAVHASVSIEKAPFHGSAASAFRCYKIYQADDRGHICISVGKEGHLMSQTYCHEQVLRQLCMEQCVNELVGWKSPFDLRSCQESSTIAAVGPLLPHRGADGLMY